MKYQNILETIGNTPLVKINNIEASNRAEIYAKFEALNPSGSIKDRMALYIGAEGQEKRNTKARSDNNRSYYWQHRNRFCDGSRHQRLQDDCGDA